jgi:hypothetical protein
VVFADSRSRVPGDSVHNPVSTQASDRAPLGGLESLIDTTTAQRPPSPLQPPRGTPRLIPPPIRPRGAHCPILCLPIRRLPTYHWTRFRRWLLGSFSSFSRRQHELSPLRQHSHYRPHPLRVRPFLVRKGNNPRMRQILPILHHIRRQDARPIPPPNAKPPAPTPGSQ